MSWPGVEIGFMLSSRFPSAKFVCAYTGLLVVFCSPALLKAADGDAELTVNGTLNTITDTEVFAGELFPLTPGDVGYESTAQRNALVVTGGGELRLSSGADVWVKNDDNHTAFLRVGYGSDASGDGTLTIQSGATLRVGSATRYANFQLGQGSGVTGTVNQTGGAATFIGSLNVGVNGGTGIYNVSGGTLTFDNAGAGAANQTSLISIGFNNSISGTSSGTMNISGGLVQVTAPHDGGSISFIIGNAALNALQAYSGTSDNNGNAGAGNGTVTQTGGTFSIGAGGTLYLSAYGNGVYNLSGGTLQVGGSGLQAQYGNHSEFTYDFNLGGGTIQVTGSDLTTSVNANLVGGTVSTIDTNGLNGTWSGNLAGVGLHQIDFGGSSLVKTGAGTLTFSGTGTTARVLDTFSVTDGTLAQTAGGTSAVELMVGSGTGSTATYNLSGGTLTINDSTKIDNSTIVVGSFRVGDFGGTGTFNQTSGTLNTPALNVGNQGGHGTYNLSGGTLNLNAGLSTLGRTSGGTVTNGGSTGQMTVSGTGVLNINAGAELVLSNWSDNLNASQGTGTLTQTGGVINVDNAAYLKITGWGTGTYNFNGGTLQIGDDSLVGVFFGEGGTYHFNLGGGTIKVTGANLVTDVNANLTAGTTSTINTNNLNATWSGNLTGAGLHQIDFGGSALVKTGAGTLTFSGTGTTARVLDTFAVTGGSVDQTAGNTSAVEFMVGTGTSNTGAYVMDGGTLTINPSTRVDNVTAVAGSFRVGDFGGTGTFTQNAGTVTVANNGALNIGNQGGTGTYNLTGGTLTLNSGNHVVGRSTSGKPASTGTLNVSGGTLVIDNGGHLILGNNIEDAGTNFGTGTLTQTGGVIRILDGGLYVGASGNGTYNLNGGTLEVAGAGLLGRYGSGAAAGVSAFNFGSATIKAIGSTGMTASVNATLVAGAVSLIDTNGLSTTWSGNLIGTGTHQVADGGNALAKIGAGTLFLSGATRTLDTFIAAAGTTQQTAGATTVGEFMTGSGNGSIATFEMNGGTLLVTSSLAANNTTVVPGSFRVGDFTGTGTFTQAGGTVTVGSSTSDAALTIGNQGGNGTYNLNGGTLRISGGNSVIARSTGANGTSTGVLNISGAGTLLEITDGSALINGNNTFGRTDGNATITQSAGTVRVTSGGLYIAGYSAGTYNFTGGTIEAGGTNGLKARYNTSTADSTFNFGGGTIKVIGSNLTTDILATLTAGVTSTVNTNGFDATFSGTLNGAGLHTATYGGNTFAKTGAGTLTLTGATRVFDTFNVAAGTAHQTTGVTTALELKAGAGVTTTYEMAGGTLNIKGSTQVDNTTAVAGTLVVGDAGGTGTFTQTAGTVTVGSTGDGELLIGREGGSGTYTLSGGTLKLSGGQSVLSRSNATHAASAASFNLSGAGTLLELINGASLVIGNDVSSGGATGTGTLTQTNGTLRVTDGTLYVAGYGAGTYNLNGGTLEVGGANSLKARYNTSTADSTFNFGAGAIKATANLTTDILATLTAGVTSTVNTNGFDATFTGTLTGAGLHTATYGGNTFAKTGTGALYLTGATRVFDTFNVAGGTARQTTGATTALELKAGAGVTSTYEIAGGTLNLKGSTQVDNTTAVAGVLIVGDAGGSGTFTQTAGTVTVGSAGSGALLVGREGGTGIYNLSGGTLSLGAGLHDLGGTTGSVSAGSGTINLSGGLIELTDSGTHLVLGDSDGAGLEGTGVLNQTGGILRVTAGAVSLSSRGNGTYNLNGGSLEVGGSGLQAFYAGAGTGTGTAAFNLGGGTIKVIGSSLVTAVSATLSTGTTSTINTNGFDATLSGSLTGQGGLTKTGLGTLFLTGASDYSGATTVSTGTLRVDGALANTGISVSSGATFSGHGTVHDLNILCGGNLVQGGTPGELSVTGNLTLAGTSYTLFGISDDSSYDSITVGGTLFAGGVLDVQFLGGFDPLSGASFDLFDGAFSGTFADVWLPTLSDGLEWNTGSLYSSGVISVETTPIPEPATWAGIFGATALVVALWRRRHAAVLTPR